MRASDLAKTVGENAVVDQVDWLLDVAYVNLTKDDNIERLKSLHQKILKNIAPVSISSSLINATNENCFLTTWNDIKVFFKHPSTTELIDIYYNIRAIKHQPGSPVEPLLMQLEAQFSTMKEVDNTIDEKHYIAHILACFKDSQDFTNVFHSAMWEDTSTLTVAKMKSILISTQQNLGPQ